MENITFKTLSLKSQTPLITTRPLNIAVAVIASRFPLGRGLVLPAICRICRTRSNGLLLLPLLVGSRRFQVPLFSSIIQHFLSFVFSYRLLKPLHIFVVDGKLGPW